jgi:molybdenum cofactor cytidylyltransferase
MRLADALRVGPRTTVAFTGAGGKSSAMGRLAAELALEAPVLLTTTTRLALSQAQLAGAHLILEDPSSLSALPGLMEANRSVLVTGPIARGEPKWLGVELAPLESVRRIAARVGAPLLIEADGARGLSLKAPAPHEPVVPSFVDVVVPMAGLDIVDSPLGPEQVHRPDLAGRVMGLKSGAPIRTEHVATLLGASNGGLQGAPPAAEVRVLLNKAETPQRLEQGRAIARLLLGNDRIHSVVLGSLREPAPIREVHGRVAGIVLAAGGSTRLNEPKQLIEWQGHPLVWRAAWAALEAGLAPVVVVVGAEAERVRAALHDLPVLIVDNPGWEGGQSTSVRAGLAAVRATAEAAVFLLADMPFVTAEIVRAVAAEHRHTLTPIVAPRAGGRWANPVLFDRAVFGDLMALSGDVGGRALFSRHRVASFECDESIVADIDTREDLRRLRRSE